MKHDKQSFVETFFKGTDIKVINGVGLLKLSDNIRVKITLSQSFVSGTYDGWLVTTINVNDAVIDNMKFKFDDHLTHAANNHPNANVRDGLQIVSHCGWDWYINRPTEKSISRMVLKMLEYIEFFK